MTTTAIGIAPDDLHTDLRAHVEALNEALAMEIPPTWPEGENYLEAPQIAAIGNVVRQACHATTSAARIEYVFRKEWMRRDKTQWGMTVQATGLLRYLGDVDYVVQINWTIWKDLSPKSRIALVDHELSHVYRDPESGTWKIMDHDIAEFVSIIDRWGPWSDDLRQATSHMEQLKLL